MRYLIIDDEANASSLLKRILEKYPGLGKDDEILVINDAIDAYDYLLQNPVNLIFLDIEMPGMTGVELSDRLARKNGSKPYIVFITAYPQYALFAWNSGAVDYIMKPYDPDNIYKAIEKYKKLSAVSPNPERTVPKKASFRCFPDFEMFVDGAPVYFKSKKGKELLAFLVHNRGNWVSLDKIILCLFENLDEISSKNYLRTVLFRLRKTLEEYHMESLIESQYGGIRIKTDQVDCDYYEYLQGKKELFNGEYMGEYPWAEAAKKHMAQN